MIVQSESIGHIIFYSRIHDHILNIAPLFSLIKFSISITALIGYPHCIVDLEVESSFQLFFVFETCYSSPSGISESVALKNTLQEDFIALSSCAQIVLDVTKSKMLSDCNDVDNVKRKKHAFFKY